MTLTLTLTLIDDKMGIYEAKNAIIAKLNSNDLNPLNAFHSNQIKSQKRNGENH